MSSNPTSAPLPASVLKLLASAPHRLLFFVGATNILLGMGWWASWLFTARWQPLHIPPAAMPAGWMHAVMMQYQVLPSFMFGFLLTVFPRWMNLPALTRWHYIPVGVGLFGGQALTLAAVRGGLPLLQAGAVLTMLGWSIGTLILADLVRREVGRTWHAISCVLALSLGLLGLALYATYLFTADGRWMLASIKMGSTALLLPIFFTVCHRMVPFFTGSVMPGYQQVRPLWALALFWIAVVLHTGLELTHSLSWLWLADLPLTALSAWLLWTWWPRCSAMPPLLRVLFMGFAWLPLAFALYAVESMQYLLYGESNLGRGPEHALYLGFFSSLLVAMVTRVTQGHSGRPLVLGAVAGFAFIVLQAVTVMRVLAEVLPDAALWQSIAALGWMIAFAPWVVRSLWIYLTPRIDGNPG